MSVVKPITNAEWTFEIIGGPQKSDLIEVAICKILDTACEEEFFFELNVHPCRWMCSKIRIRIVKIEKISNNEWIIIGDWLDAKFEARPCSFKAKYSSLSRRGEIIFSFKYGWLSIALIDCVEHRTFHHFIFGEKGEHYV